MKLNTTWVHRPQHPYSAEGLKTPLSQSEEMQKSAICIVEAGGAPDAKPQRVKVYVQKLGRLAYKTLPAEFDLACLQKASARSEDALVKMVVTLSYGKATTTIPVAEFMRRLGEETNSTREQEKVEEEAPWVSRISVCKCSDCVLPFWPLLRAWEPPLVKPRTEMDTNVDIRAVVGECKAETGKQLEDEFSFMGEDEELWEVLGDGGEEESSSL
ncbi:hypothetical protein E2C01_051481 [Portunus trituberculatus]|uniref:Uncharacterized protein n=1 Tax=Portunus trituberculatus TaxID=210409 RepID=A0A5B7GB36_PORTR|nr:hypothetical protein [Portunus trituberculatus]